MTTQNRTKHGSIPIRSAGWVFKLLAFWALIGGVWIVSQANSFAKPPDFIDTLDVYPPRWRLEKNDCDARLIEQDHRSGGAFAESDSAFSPVGDNDGNPAVLTKQGGYESISIQSGTGTHAHLIYPIEPTLPLDETSVVATIRSSEVGPTIGVRIKYPFLKDPETRRPHSVVLTGASYRNVGQWQRIGISQLETLLNKANRAVRNRFGATADIRDAMVDAVVVNAYVGPGRNTVDIDQLEIERMVSVASAGSINDVAGNANPSTGEPTADVVTAGKSVLNNARRSLSPERSVWRPFPAGKMIRVIQYNGEPLSYLHSLGFDAIWMDRACDLPLLIEAGRVGIEVYCQLPEPIDPKMEPHLDVVAGWIVSPNALLSDSMSLDESSDRRSGAADSYGSESRRAFDLRHLEFVRADVARLRRLPSRWQRGLVAAPSEGYESFGRAVDAVIAQAPPRQRGLAFFEEQNELRVLLNMPRDRTQCGVSIESSPPIEMIRGAERAGARLGAGPPPIYPWHSMWAQATRMACLSPDMILFRSSRALTHPNPAETYRARSLSYVNRMLAALGPWLSQGNPVNDEWLMESSEKLRYDSAAIRIGDTYLVALFSTVGHRNQLLAGDGGQLSLRLPPPLASASVWRATDFSASVIPVQQGAMGPTIDLVSPDVVEWLVISTDIAVGGKLAASMRPFASVATSDRWMLADALVQSASTGFSARQNRESRQGDLLRVASDTLRQSEPAFRAGNSGVALHAARRADAWALRSQANLWSPQSFWSHSAIDVGHPELLLAIEAANHQLQRNLLTSGSLDDRQVIQSGGWSFGRRLTDRIDSEIKWVSSRTFEGLGALRMVAAPKVQRSRPAAIGTDHARSPNDGVSMNGPGRPRDTRHDAGGGYSGTVMQVESPSVYFSNPTTIVLECMVKTLGFDSPHQGVLVYDSHAGPAAGVLVRNSPDWQPVRLVRFIDQPTQVSLRIEVLGGGEAMVDNVRVRELKSRPPRLPFSPLASGHATDQTIQKHRQRIARDGKADQSLDTQDRR